MTKTEKSVEKQVKELRAEIDKLKGSFFDLDRDVDTRINQFLAQLNQTTAVVDYHAHPTTLMSGRAIFLEDKFKAAVAEAQAAQAPPTSVEKEEEKEE